MQAPQQQGGERVALSKRVIVPSSDQKDVGGIGGAEVIEERDETCYVCNLAASPPLPVSQPSSNQPVEMLASADSSHSICLFSRQTLDFIGKIPAHNDTVTQISFDRTNAALLWSSSADGSLKCWDLRSQQLACTLRANKQIYSFDIGGDMMLVAGSKENILFWDMRRASTVTTPLVTFSESHTEDVTKVLFHPHVPNKLFTGSIDGLICLFDTTQPSEEDALLSVMPVDQAVSTFGFFGPTGADVYALSTDQRLSLWNIDACEELGKLDDPRQALAGTVAIDYLIDCHYEPNVNKLFLLTGTNNGAVDILLVEATGIAPMKHLEGGHSAIVRCFDWNTNGKAILTGGEDSAICLWAFESS